MSTRTFNGLLLGHLRESMVAWVPIWDPRVSLADNVRYRIYLGGPFRVRIRIHHDYARDYHLADIVKLEICPLPLTIATELPPRL